MSERTIEVVRAELAGRLRGLAETLRGAPAWTGDTVRLQVVRDARRLLSSLEVVPCSTERPLLAVALFRQALGEVERSASALASALEAVADELAPTEDVDESWVLVEEAMLAAQHDLFANR